MPTRHKIIYACQPLRRHGDQNHASHRVARVARRQRLAARVGLMRVGPKAVKCCFSRQQLLASDSCAYAMAVNGFVQVLQLNAASPLGWFVW